MLALCARIPGNELVSAECQNLTGGVPDAFGLAACRRLDLIPRAAFVSLGLRCLAEGLTLEDLVLQVRRAELHVDRFRIDMKRLTPGIQLSEREAIVAIADVLHGAPDLGSPLHRFLILARKDRLRFGELLACSQRDYQLHDAKPYRTTSSLPSRLARALVNLAAPSAKSILDPFCGTGSILLEAQAIGLASFGMDLNPKMVGMSRLNLEHFGYPAQVDWGDALDCPRTADAVVTDLPYGRILKIDPGRLLAILRHTVRLAPVGIYLTEADISELLLKAGYKEVAVYRVPKRRGMERLVHRAISG
jgi:tRNA G10  N-methylase Trm11